MHGMMYGRWTTIAEIEREVTKNVSPAFFHSVSINEEIERYSFIVDVKLKWWTWLALGFIHRHYRRKLQERCDVGKPIAIVGTVVVR